MKRTSRLICLLFFVLLVTTLSASAITVSLGTSSSSGEEPLDVNLSCSVSGANATYGGNYYIVTFGDGEIYTLTTTNISVTVEHEYTNDGTYTATCNVTDSINSSNTDEEIITVTDASPSISISQSRYPTSPIVGNTISFNITVTNNGNVPLSPVLLRNTFDNNNMDFSNSNLSSYDDLGAIVEWENIGYLDVGASITVTTNFTADTTGTTSNTVNASANYSSVQVSAQDVSSFTIVSNDTERPSVILDSPIDEYYNPDNIVRFLWNVTDDKDYEVTCNLTIDDEVARDEIAVANNSRKSREITLEPGEHTWSISCWDDAQNIETTDTQTVFVMMDSAEVDYNVSFTYGFGIYTFNDSSTVMITLGPKNYLLKIVEVYAGSVRISIPQITETHYLQLDTITNIDLDLDSNYDISIQLLSLIESTTAKMKIWEYGDPDVVVKASTNISDNTTANTSDTIQTTDTNTTTSATNKTVTSSDKTESVSMVDQILANHSIEDIRDQLNGTETHETLIEKFQNNPEYIAFSLIGLTIFLIGIGAIRIILFKEKVLPEVPDQVIDYVENAIKDGVYTGQIESSLVKGGWSESEIRRALLFARTRLDIENKVAPEFIRSDLLAEGWSPEEIREAFTYFNVKINVEKKIPLETVQQELLKRGVPNNEINRAVLYSKVMDSDKLFNEEDLIKVLKQKGWSKDQVKRALFYAYVKKLLSEGISIGKIEKELLKKSRSKEELSKMIKRLKKHL